MSYLAEEVSSFIARQDLKFYYKLIRVGYIKLNFISLRSDSQVGPAWKAKYEVRPDAVQYS